MNKNQQIKNEIKQSYINRKPLPIIEPSVEELAAHEKRLEAIKEESGGKCVWIDSGYD